MVHTIVRPSWARRFNREMQRVHDELSRPLQFQSKQMCENELNVVSRE